MKAMTKVRVWTKQEDEIVLKFYKEKSLKSISDMIGRSPDAIRMRYSLLKRKLENDKASKIKKVCPVCGGKSTNRVKTSVGRKVIDANYCLDCFHEFTETEIISPLWMHEG